MLVPWAQPRLRDTCFTLPYHAKTPLFYCVATVYNTVEYTIQFESPKKQTKGKHFMKTVI
jgi:hypothetical protein